MTVHQMNLDDTGLSTHTHEHTHTFSVSPHPENRFPPTHSDFMDVEQTVIAGKLEGDVNFDPFRQFDLNMKADLLLVCILDADDPLLSIEGLEEGKVFTRDFQELQPSKDRIVCRFVCSEDFVCFLATASCGSRAYWDFTTR